VNQRTQGTRLRWRRASSLFAYWIGSRLVVENYRTGEALSAHPVTARVLHIFSDWCSLDAVRRELPEFSAQSVRQSIRQLVSHGLVLTEGSSEAKEDQAFRDAWSSWLPHAAVLHFGTKDMPYTTSDEETVERMRLYLEESEQPAPFRSLSKKLSSSKLRLPQTAPADSDFLRTLLARRTHREFSRKPLDLNNLSSLLRYTWGLTGYINDWLMGDLPLKTSPSAGARHPCEVYVLAQQVKGLEPGLYHYASDSNRLRPIAQEVTRETGVQYCAGQEWVRGAAALFIITAVFPRSMWKYRFPRAYRTVLADAAHLCQTFCLVATYLQLAPFCTMALKDTLIERDLGIDGINESVLYVAGVGLPALRVSN
jgi:SagB-type dehydrogenase family enzyme